VTDRPKTPSKPPGGKPFLGDDDILSELDAWDATFDALHSSGPEEGKDAAPAPGLTESQHVIAWPAADAARRGAAVASPAELADPTALTMTPDPRGLDRLGSEFDADPELPELPDREPEDDLAIRGGGGSEGEGGSEGGSEGGIEDRPPGRGPAPHRRATSSTSVDSAHLEDPLETDFSDLAQVAVSTRPTRETLPPPIDDDAAELIIGGDEDEDDDDVFTSASRPNPKPVRQYDDDDLAPPPPPVEPRRTVSHAIVRRNTMAIAIPSPIVSDDSQVTPSHGTDLALFAERTRLTAPDELEASMAASREELLVDEDAYDDIEIGAGAGAGAGGASGEVARPEEERIGARPGLGAPAAPSVPAPVSDAFSAGRRTAHVLRRAETPTRPPPAVQPVIEIEADDELSAPSLAAKGHAPPAEDDFSEVAAAVGAAGDVDAAARAPDLGGRRPPTPPLGSRERPRTFDLDLEDEAPASAPQQTFEAALDDFEDEPQPETGIVSTLVDSAPPPPTLVESGRLPQALAEAARQPAAFSEPGRPPARPAPAPAASVETRKGLPALGEAGRAPAPGLRPPAITDLYPPRVKTPTSVPPLGPAQPAQPAGQRARPLQPVAAPAAQPAGAPDESDELEPLLDLEVAGRAWPEQVMPWTAAALDEACASSLLVYEREVANLDDSAASAALRIEAGRLCERLADLERARTHYDAALLADPRATAALRGLRRIARAAGDLVEATRLLDLEIAVAGALERRPLGHYRIDLLMASGEQDLARVAVGELLDVAPSDVRALLAHLELAFLDGRADEFGAALEQLAHAVTDHELRAAAQSARGALAAQQNDTVGVMTWFNAAAAADPGALAARLGAVRYAAAQADGAAAAGALVDLGRQIEATDQTTAAAAGVRAQQWSTAEIGIAASLLSASAAPSDPLVARLGAEIASRIAAEEPGTAGAAFAHWAACAAAPAERAYAAARAAELDPSHGAELWATVLELDPGDDYAAAQLRTAHVASEATEASIEVDIAVAADAERDRARLRAAFGLIAVGKLDDAIELLARGREQRPGSLAIAEALGEALAAAGNWTARAQLFGELAAEPGEQLDRDVAQLRGAIAWEEAVGAAAAAAEAPEPDGVEPPELPAAITAALEAWERVLEHSASAPAAHAAAILLASRLGDRDALADVLARAQAAERSPWAAASLGLRRARLYADDPQHVEELLRNLQPAEDPRRTVGLVLAAARLKNLGDAAAALEERARLLDERSSATEVAALRLRAAQLALDAGDAARATRLLGKVEQALPGLGMVPDLLAAARRRAGDRPAALAPGRRAEPPPGTSAADAFARLVRDADLAFTQGDGVAAISLYQRALELRPGDPLAAVPLVRVATQIREPAAVTTFALAQLKHAEDADDGAAKAAAYELLAHIDLELRGDPDSAQIALESAAQSEPGRVDLLHRLERNRAAADDVPELLRLRTAVLDVVPPELARDRAALLLDLAGLATRDNQAEPEHAAIYRRVLEADPAVRLALMHLEAIVRRTGPSEELAGLEEKIALYFDGDARTQATFWTRAGETLAAIGQIDAAVQRFGRAETALPGHVPAIEGWRHAALKGQLWIDLVEATNRQAAGATDPGQRAALHHFAGVVLMDKALVGDRAMEALHRALEADPGHRDAFLRLRILLEEDGNHEELAALLARRLDVEPDPDARVELHRALAELHRNFLSDRDTAKEHYRAILARDANDLRAHAAISDIAWEQGSWQEAADALVARARLERDPEILKGLCYRLGLIYADRLVDPPMALKAFQRALTYQPDDEATLVRLADLATQTGEFKIALGACERLVKNEVDPDRRVAHLHRVAKIFRHGFGDLKRAERALNLALDGAPTNDEALAQLVGFYKDASDLTSARVHLNRVVGTMRTRAHQAPLDGVAYRVISRAMAARAATGVEGSLPLARAAAQLAQLLGAAGEPEQRLLAEAHSPDLSLLARQDAQEADDALFPRGVPPELRQIFHLLGDRIAKHVGIDLRQYGATRGDRLRARDNPVAAVAQSVATALGFGDIDVYVSARQPWVMIAEPTSPVSLIIGASIAGEGGDAIRFAAGGALKLAQAHLAIPARLPEDDLGVLVVALMRLFQPEFPMLAVDGDAVAVQLQKLRRLIPTSLMNELRPFALAVDPQSLGHREIARDIKVAGLRAGLVASGSLLVGLRILAGQAQGELPGFLADPVAQGLISFALSEDHAAIAR
jgi:hypothetical protein